MRRLLLLIPLCGALACGGDFTAATADVTFTPIEEDDPALGEAEIGDEPEAPLDETAADPVDDPVDGSTDQPAEDPPHDPDTPVDDTPDWTDHEDPAVEGCLQAFPAICEKVEECGAEQPVLSLLGGFCPSLFDSISDMLVVGCEQMTGLLGEALPGVEIPLAGNLQDILSKLMLGCIENFQCDPGYLQELGQKFAEVLSLFGGQGGGGGDITTALPALLELAEMCGGLGNLLPF